MTVAELSKAMGITPMAVRQHLMSLERKRIVEYEAKKYGIGRPLFLYRLTDKANEIFPHAHTDFLMEVLRTIESMDGREKVDDVFRKISEYHLDDKKRSLRGIEDFTEKIIAFTEVLSKDGYLIELEEKDGAFELKQYNCLLSSVAREYPETRALRASTPKPAPWNWTSTARFSAGTSREAAARRKGRPRVSTLFRRNSRVSEGRPDGLLVQFHRIFFLE
jgi:predicted ArsR family transcriptional regulator